MARLALRLLELRIAVCRLARDAAIPSWATEGDFFAVLRSYESLSVLCAEDAVPTDVEHTPGWRALRLEGEFDFEQSGVLAAVAIPLGEAEIPTLVVSTFETDYFLVQDSHMGRTVTSLQQAGHEVVGTAHSD